MYCEDVYDQLPVLLFPLPHTQICANDKLDIIVDVLRLSALFMQGNGTECQGFEDSLDVGLRSTRDTHADSESLSP